MKKSFVRDEVAPAGGGMLGSGLGAIVGGIIGGPVGAFFGRAIGRLAGSEGTKKIVGNELDELKTENTWLNKRVSELASMYNNLCDELRDAGKELEDTRKELENIRMAALVFMEAADTYQEAADRKIKVKVEELEDKDGSSAFMDAADTYQEAAEMKIKIKVEELDDMRKAALVFMDAADAYQETVEHQIKAKMEELKDTRKAALVFMDAADTYQEATERQIKAKLDELDNTRKAALVFIDAADTYQEAAERQIKAKLDDVEDMRKVALVSTRHALAQELKLLVDKKEELHARVESLEADAMVKKGYDSVTDENDMLLLEVLTIEKEYSLSQVEIKRPGMEVGMLTEANEVATEAYDTEKVKMMKELEDFKRKVEENHTGKEVADEVGRNRDAHADKLRVELEELIVSMSQLQASYDKLDAKHSFLNNEKNSIKKALDAESAQACKLMSIIDALDVLKGGEIEKLKVKLEEQKGEIDILNKEIELL